MRPGYDLLSLTELITYQKNSLKLFKVITKVKLASPFQESLKKPGWAHFKIASRKIFEH